MDQKKWEAAVSRLFLRYAIPAFGTKACSMASILEGREPGTEIDKEKLIDHVLSGAPLHESLDRFFPNAVRTLSALSQGNPITEETVRSYFLEMHRELTEGSDAHTTVEEALEHMVWPAKVTKVISKERAEVETPVGSMSVNTRLVDMVKNGEYLTIHSGWACERIEKPMHDRLYSMHREKGPVRLARKPRVV